MSDNDSIEKTREEILGAVRARASVELDPGDLESLARAYAAVVSAKPASLENTYFRLT